MTKFAETVMRKMCRNPKCRSTLPTPVSNEKQAFCAKGCYSSFYLHRCRVCEAELPKAKGRPRLICKKAKCRNAWNAGEGFGRYASENFSSQVSKNPEKSSGKAMDIEVFCASDTGEAANRAYAKRPWRAVAGRLSLNQYQRAVVGDAKDGGLPDIPYAKVWAGGDWEGTENRNRKLLEKFFAGLKDQPVWTVSPSTFGAASVANRPDLKIPDDLSTPAFLDRRPLPLQRAA
jgi:hypothetical protein